MPHFLYSFFFFLIIIIKLSWILFFACLGDVLEDFVLKTLDLNCYFKLGVLGMGLGTKGCRTLLLP
jgi:hypothetical protein